MSDEIITAPYKITGLVDIFDEQGNITGQYPVGSVQMLTIDRGNAAVEAGQAEIVPADEPAEAAADVPPTDEDALPAEEETDIPEDGGPVEPEEGVI